MEVGVKSKYDGKMFCSDKNTFLEASLTKFGSPISVKEIYGNIVIKDVEVRSRFFENLKGSAGTPQFVLEVTTSEIMIVWFYCEAEFLLGDAATLIK